MCNIYNEETVFYSLKRRSLLVADIGIFTGFLVLEKKNNKMCSFNTFRCSIYKNVQEKKPEKFDCPVHQIRKCKKRQDSFRVCSFYIYGKAHTERCASNKWKVEVRCQYHFRSHKRWKIWFLKNFDHLSAVIKASNVLLV